MNKERMMVICEIHQKSYDKKKIWKCPECDKKLAHDALLPNQERRDAEIKRKQRGRI